MSSFRFLHAADIHLDSPLTGLARYEGLPVEEVRNATRAAFDNLIRFACDEAVDFVVIAGDLFDGDWRDMRTGLYFTRAMGRLQKADIPVYLLQGNHDAGSVLTKSLPWPDNVHRFGTRTPQTFRLDALGVALHGWSFAHQAAPDNLALRYPDAEAGHFNIGVLHTSLSGREGHARYAPCEIADLKARGYDYWALGHVHAFERVCDDPAMVFPGNVQGRNVRETGAKGAVLVEVEDRVIERIERIDLDVLRWARIVVDCAACDTVETVQDRIGAGLSAIRAGEDAGRGLVVRVVLEGETVLADTLADRHGALRDEARALAGAIAGDLWIEKLSVHTRRPVEAQAEEASDDLVAMLAGAEHDPALAAALAADLTPFMTAVAAALPPEADDLRHVAAAGEWDRVAAAAASGLRARLGRTD
jgi:DNA repair exonuclease SbcCD nuclease subunit